MRPGTALLAALSIASAALVALSPSPAHAADDNPLGLSVIETPDLKLIYLTPTLDYLTPHVVRTFTNSVRWQKERFGWIPSQPVGVFLKDFSDYGNAGASPMPRNLLRVEIEPSANAFETNPGSERMYSLMNHELVHIATADVASPEDRFWRGVFLGKVSPQASNPESLLYSYLTVPRFNVPRWLLEGSAVFMETWMAGGFGRAQGGYDEMVFRGMVRDHQPFYDPLGLESRGARVDFQVGVTAYLYGTRFMTWLSLTYSPEQVVQWLRRDEGSKRHYAAAFEQVFGLPLNTAWQHWIDDETRFQEANLREVRKVPITPMRALTRQALGSSSRLYLDAKNDVLYGAFRRPGIVEFIGAVNVRDGSVRSIVDLVGGALFSVTSLAFDPDSRTLFYNANNLDRRDLVAYELDTGRQTVLLERARIGALVFDRSDRSLYGVRHSNGIASLVRVPFPYTTGWQTLHTFGYEVVPTNLDISPDNGSLSASVKEVNGDQSLRVWSLSALREGRLEQTAQFQFGQAAPEGFVFSPDGRSLYGSSYYTGVSNIFRCDVATGTFDAVTNAEVGVFRPLPFADGRLLVLAYTGRGFLPSLIDRPVPLDDVSAIRFLGTEVAERHPVVKTWQVPPTAATDTLEPTTPPRPYDPRREVGLLNGYPVLQGYKQTSGLGYQANFTDLLGFARVGLTAAFTPSDRLSASEKAHVALTGNYLGYSGSLSWNRSDFYDLFGPTQRSRKGFAAKFSDNIPLLYDRFRSLDFRYDVAHYRGIDTLPNAQNVGSNVSVLTTAATSLTYSYLRRSLGAVDEEEGISAVASLKGNFAPGVRTVQLRGNVDAGLALPFDHTSIWFRTAAGVAGGDRGNTLAPFYFGAFGNNRLDDGEVRRYRDYDSLPGFGIDEVSALSFVRESVELDLPPLVFASAGVPDLHLNWLRPALFATALRTDPQSRARRADHESIGIQLDLRFSLLHWYEAILSVGVAEGFDGKRRVGHEGLVSLKIL